LSYEQRDEDMWNFIDAGNKWRDGKVWILLNERVWVDLIKN